jgi:hypothetical protein
MDARRVGGRERASEQGGQGQDCHADDNRRKLGQWSLGRP